MGSSHPTLEGSQSSNEGGKGPVKTIGSNAYCLCRKEAQSSTVDLFRLTQ